MSAVGTIVPDTARTAPRFAVLRERGMGAGVLVAALSSAFGVVLLDATAYIAAMLQSDPYIGDSDILAFVIGILSVLLVGVALYVAAIVTSNTFATIVAGRTRRIALVRLIGGSARSQRVEVARQGLAIGTIGALLGLGVGLAISALGVWVADRVLIELPGFSVFQPTVLVPVAAVVLTTWAAAWVGSRRVLTVTPLQALGGSVERTHEETASRPVRHVVSLILLIVGAALLALGVAAGLVTPLGVVIAFFGGLLSFTAISLAAARVMPPLLRAVGGLFGRSATARLAAENALRHPDRSSRMAIGVVMGVALVTMFAVALESVKKLLTKAAGGELDPQFTLIMDGFASIMMVLVGVSAVIAAVGLINLLTLGVVQRRRELGLLRAIGLSNRQVREMILLEALHITITATLTGLALGVIYGWIAAQSLLASVRMPPTFDQTAGLVAPAVPWIPVVIIAVAAGVLTLVAAAVPTRLATRVAPVEALAVD